MGKPVFQSFACMPMEAFDNIYFPVMLTCSALAGADGIMWTAAAAEGAYLLVPFLKKSRMAMTYIKGAGRRK